MILVKDEQTNNMKTLSFLLLVGFLAVSCENKTQNNDVDVYEDSLLLEDTYQETVPMTDTLNMNADSTYYETDTLNMRIE